MGYQFDFARMAGEREGINSLQDLLFADGPPARQASADERRELLRLGKEILRMRRERETLFGKDLFADPSWDIMLDLFVSEIEGVRVTISSACIAASAPQTTGLRHLKTLESRGLIRRVDDRFDKRRAYVVLTEPARELMVDLLRTHQASTCRAASSNPQALGF